MSEATVLVVDNLSTLAVETGSVGGVFVAAVARGGDALDIFALNEYDNVLPVMSVAVTAASSVDSAPTKTWSGNDIETMVK